MLIMMLAFPLAICALMLRPEGLALPDLARERVASGLTASLPPGAQIILGETRLQLNANWRPVVSMDEVQLIDKEGRPVAEVPRVSAALHRNGLILGRVQPAHVAFHGLTISVARTRDGTFLISLDNDTQLPSVTNLGDIVAIMNETMGQPRLAQLDSFSLSDLTLQIRDPLAGRAFGLQDGSFNMTRKGDGLAAQLSVVLRDPTDTNERRDPRFLDGRMAARVRFNLSTQADSRAAQLSFQADNISPQLIAAQNPALSGLSVIDAPMSVSMRGALDQDGFVDTMSGTLDVAEGELQLGAETVGLEALKAYLEIDSETDALVLQSVQLQSDAINLEMSGQVTVDESQPAEAPGLAVLAQLQMTNIGLDLPQDLPVATDAPVMIDQVQADLRYDFTEQRLDLGAVTALVGPSQAHMSGYIQVTGEGPILALDGAVEDISFDRAAALWPTGVIAKTRGWLIKNLSQAEMDRMDFSVRKRPEQEKPNVGLSADYKNGRLTFLPNMPALTNGSGFFSLNGTRFALTVDQGTVMADGAALSAAGSVFSVEDTRIKPAHGRVALQLQGPVRGALALLSRDPVNMPVDQLSITGSSNFQADIAFPLGKDPSPDQIDWTAHATLERVNGDDLIAGRELRAGRLNVRATKEQLNVTGGVMVQGVPATIALTRAMGADANPRVQITGALDLSADSLAKFGVQIDALSIDGTAPASFVMDVVPGQAPRLQVSSQLVGTALGIETLGWRKPRSAKADLALDLTLGDPVQVTGLSMSGAGLHAKGSVRLGAGNQLEVAQFDTITVEDWLDVSARLIGRGAGRPAALEVTGGRLDLRGLSGQSTSQNGATAPARGPVSVSLDRVQVASGLRVTNVTGALAEGTVLNGSFTGRANGTAPIRAEVVANQGTTSVRVRAEDAGQALAAVGVLENGRGGALDMVLQSRSGGAASSTWDGQLSIDNLVVTNAPTLAGLLSAISVVGILEQMANGGLSFGTTEANLTLSPDGIMISEGRANGPSMGVTFEGLVSPARDRMDLQGVISPLNILNGIGGALFARRGEGLFGFSYRLFGPLKTPRTEVNPLSILTPGVFRDIFRREPPVLE